MWKAIKDIGDYKVGDEVPEEQAIIWSKMYAEPHVERVSDSDPGEASEESESEEAVSKDTSSDEEQSKDDSSELLDDYLARNQNVVTKNVESDKLTLGQVKKLINLENNGRRRSKVSKALKEKLKSFD